MSDKLIIPPPRPGRRITLSLSPAAAMGGIVGLCAGFVLIFSLGVLLGRGHNLGKSIPELERIMPERAVPAPPQVIAEDVNPAAPQTPAAQSAPQSEGDAAHQEPPASGVIAQGDLGYRENLKQPAPAARPAAAQGKPSAKPGDEPKQTDKATDKLNASDKTVDKPKPAATRAGASPDLRPLSSGPERTAPIKPVGQEGASSGDTQLYHYIYQAAAYKDELACAAFADKLKKAGFKAGVQKSVDGATTWYRTVVDFTGKPDDTDALREKLKQHGVPRVIMTSKTPAR